MSVNAEKLDKILPLMFRQVQISERAKAELKQQLLGSAELSESQLSLIAAAGLQLNNKKKEMDLP